MQDAPPQYTRFTAAELERGFLALAFGSDLRIGARPLGIRRFDHPIRVRVIGGGSVGRKIAMSRILSDYAREVPRLQLSETSASDADVELRLIDEKDFRSALQLAFGARRKTTAELMVFSIQRATVACFPANREFYRDTVFRPHYLRPT